MTLFREDRPTLVIDAKYKPRYVSGAPDAPVPTSRKVSNADIYQLFFYQARLRLRYEMDFTPGALIVVPVIRAGSAVSAPILRTVMWSGDSHVDAAYGLRVLPIRLPETLQALMSGQGEEAALAANPEVVACLTDLLVAGRPSMMVLPLGGVRRGS